MKRILLTTLAVALSTAMTNITVSAETCNNCYVGDLPSGSSGSVVGDSTVSDYSNSIGGDFTGCQPRRYGNPDLFYNFYTQGNCNQANAQMYLSPLPVPPHVGHTFYTYQPMYPHHMLYSHKDRFHRYYDYGRGMNRTRATYYSPPVHTAVSNFYWNVLRLPR